MAIFANEADFVQSCPVNLGSVFKNMKQDIELAADTYVFPYCSKEQYEDIKNSQNAKAIEYVRLLKLSTAYLALHLYMPIGKSEISSQGIVQVVTEGKKQASAEDKEDLSLSSKAKGLMYLEMLLAHLEKNDAFFEIWKQSDSYSRYTKYLVRSADEFRLIEGKRHVFMGLQSYIEDVEFEIIEGLIPDNILYKLYSREFGNDPNIKKIYEELLTKYVQPVVASLALARAISAMAIVRDSYNTLTVFDDTRAGKSRGLKEAPTNKLDRWQADLERRGNTRLSMIKAYLQKYATELQYIAPNAENETIPFRNEDYFNTIFLG
jgi:hypothetical protein